MIPPPASTGPGLFAMRARPAPLSFTARLFLQPELAQPLLQILAGLVARRQLHLVARLEEEGQRQPRLPARRAAGVLHAVRGRRVVAARRFLQHVADVDDQAAEVAG